MTKTSGVFGTESSSLGLLWGGRQRQSSKCGVLRDFFISALISGFIRKSQKSKAYVEISGQIDGKRPFIRQFCGLNCVMCKTNSDDLFLLLVKAENRILVECLVKEGVEFVVVGSTALIFYGLGEIAGVGDLDLLLNDTADNARHVLSALATAGTPVNATAEQLARPYAQIKLKESTPYWADLITAPEEMSFAQIWSNAFSATKDGLTLKVASIAHLTQMKRIAISAGGGDMAKYQADLESLLSA